MRFSYKFSNLLGTVYREGDILFTPDGNSVISPVGNRITIYDLKNNKSCTLPVESEYNYTALDLAPSGSVLLAVNEAGEAHMISMMSKMIIQKIRFNRRVHCVKFSPDGKYFAICRDTRVFVYYAPGVHPKGLNPFVVKRIFTGTFDETLCLDWTSDSRVIAVGSKDMAARLFAVDDLEYFGSYSLGTHSDALVGCFFEKGSLDISTLSANGQLCVWEASVELDSLKPSEPASKVARVGGLSDSEDDVDTERGEEQKKKEKRRNPLQTSWLFYKRLARHFLTDALQERDARLTAAAYHKDTHILVTGFSCGSFLVHELPEVTMIHSLSISDHEVASIAMNDTGDWIALGCRGLGQLLVWEWQSETYVMKQQGHATNMTCLAYSPDGQYIITGGDDGKVKLWNTSSGFCFVTFHEHSSGVSAVQFSRNRKFVVSASLDGTVRAYDLVRYRNFRTLATPRPVQLASLALDTAGELVAAGGQDVFEVYLWSIKLGRLLEVLAGHEGPVVSVAFSPGPGATAMASVSWDHTLRLWNAVEAGPSHETVQLTSDGLCVVYRPDGLEVAVATLDGQISFFDVKTSDQVGSIEGRTDLGSGRLGTDLVTAKKSLQGKAFTSLCYTADGQCLLAGGQSKNICIYNIAEAVLLKKFVVTHNRSFDGVDDFINRRKMTEFGNLDLVEQRDDGSSVALSLPGVRRGDMAARVHHPEVRVMALQFSPTGQAWAAVTTEGLLVYGLDHSLVFDPFQLELTATPDTARSAQAAGENTKGLMIAIKLNEQPLIQEIIENIPPLDVRLTVASLPDSYMLRVLRFVAASLESTRHLEFYLDWVQSIVTAHGPKLYGKSNPSVMPVLLMLQKNLTRKYDDLSKICDFNKYTLQCLARMSKCCTTSHLLTQDQDQDTAGGSDIELMSY